MRISDWSSDVCSSDFVMVSRFGHCLNDLLYRYSIGALPIEIPAIVSNHRDSYQRAAALDIPYHHLPVTPSSKARQEDLLLRIVEDERIDLVVLARYMQVLRSEEHTSELKSLMRISYAVFCL